MKKEDNRELREFWKLWSTQTVSSLGTAMVSYALIAWVYGQSNTASSVTWLTICTFLPTILFRFIGGTMADRWNKKRIMVLSDVLAACGSAILLMLYRAGLLRVWHIYLINILLSLMNAVQSPAAFVATSLLVPKEHYTRIGGLQGFSGAAVSILAPALGSSLLALGGMEGVLMVDLCTFLIALGTLCFAVRIPEEPDQQQAAKPPFWNSCVLGLRYLRRHGVLMRVTLSMAAVNLLAKMGNDGMLAPFVLARAGGDQRILGAIQSCVSLGLMAGSLLTSAMKPSGNKVRLIYASTALVFAGNIVQGLSTSPWVWCSAAFGSYLMAAVMNANLSAVMREQVPAGMQGRVFSMRDTLQNGLIPLALLLGGQLADRVLEPLMAVDSPLQRMLAPLLGTGSGSGIALQFVLVGLAGVILSLLQWKVSTDPK